MECAFAWMDRGYDGKYLSTYHLLYLDLFLLRHTCKAASVLMVVHVGLSVSRSGVPLLFCFSMSFLHLRL